MGTDAHAYIACRQFDPHNHPRHPHRPDVAALVASSRDDGKSSTYRDPIVCLSRTIAALASSADANSTKAMPLGLPSSEVTMWMESWVNGAVTLSAGSS